MEEAKIMIKETEDMENVQLAENVDVEDIVPTSGEERRGLLKKTKIVKQTWSILEIYQKVQAKKLILDPTYQRNEIWQSDKRIPFVESLDLERESVHFTGLSLCIVCYFAIYSCA